MKKIEIQLETVTCPSCVKKIENALGKTNGVENAKVLFHSSKVKADFDENIVSADAIIDVVNKLGFDVISSNNY